MIVPMKKVTVIFDASHSDHALKALREYGGFHPVPINSSAHDSEWFRSAQEKIRIHEKAMSICSSHPAPELSYSKYLQDYAGDITAVSERIIEIHAESRNLKKSVPEYEKEFDNAALWGKLDRNVISLLEQHACFLKFFRCSEKDFRKLGENMAVFKVFRQGGEIVAGYVSDSSSPDMASGLFHEVSPPEINALKLSDMIRTAENSIGNHEKELEELCCFIEEIIDEYEKLRMEVEFESVKAEIIKNGRLGILSGFCPEESLEKLMETARRNSWAMLMECPSVDDPVPTLSRYSALSSAFRPVMDFMGILPSYHEPDTSLAFLVFLTFFFAILVGDAGYGGIMFAGTLLAGIIDKKINKETLRLFYILSLSAVIWGAVTGMWFGSERIAQLPFIRNLIIPDLYAFSEKSDANVMKICLITAFFQLSLAHIWKGFRLFPDLRFIAEAGWTALLFGIYGIAGSMLHGAETGNEIWISVLCGTACIIVFSRLGNGGIMKNIISAISVIPQNLLSGIGCFSDSISYIRLFAVGLASRELASAFNSLAMSMGTDSFFSASAAVIIFITGHAINILLACMSVMVHGIRLNLLEFSNHLGMEWAGIPYRPFRLSANISREKNHYGNSYSYRSSSSSFPCRDRFMFWHRSGSNGCNRGIQKKHNEG